MNLCLYLYCFTLIIKRREIVRFITKIVNGEVLKLLKERSLWHLLVSCVSSLCECTVFFCVDGSHLIYSNTWLILINSSAIIFISISICSIFLLVFYAHCRLVKFNLIFYNKSKIMNTTISRLLSKCENLIVGVIYYWISQKVIKLIENRVKFWKGI